MNKMLFFIFIFTSLYLFIGVVDRTGEFENNYVFFFKKTVVFSEHILRLHRRA